MEKVKILLDTNAYTRIALHVEALIDIVDKAESVFISATVLGELYAGFQMGNRLDQNLRELDRFLELPGVEILEIDKEIAFRYGILIKFLREQGTPIPSNDIWIAAGAMETGSRLVTYDNHFSVIPGLVVLSPL